MQTMPHHKGVRNMPLVFHSYSTMHLIDLLGSPPAFSSMLASSTSSVPAPLHLPHPNLRSASSLSNFTPPHAPHSTLGPKKQMGGVRATQTLMAPLQTKMTLTAGSICAHGTAWAPSHTSSPSSAPAHAHPPPSWSLGPIAQDLVQMSHSLAARMMRRYYSEQRLITATMLRYCRNVRPTWVKFNSKDTKESEWCSRF